MEASLQTPQEIRDFIISTIKEEFERNRRQGFSGIEKELLERMVRIEEELKLIHLRFEAVDKRFEAIDKRFEDLIAFNKDRFDAVDKRFEAVDKRFEAVDKRFEAMDKRFEDLIAFNKDRFEAVDKRFDRMDRNMKWLFGFAITFLTLLMSFYKFIG